MPEVISMGVCDGRGVRICSDDEPAQKALSSAILQLSQDDPTWYLGPATLDERPVSADTIALLARLSDSAGAPVGTFIILAPGAAGNTYFERIDPIVQCIRNELALTSELNFMTEELTERYEELNLVYHTEDQVNYFREGRDALTQLVENCNNYLGVGLTALLLKGKKIEVVRNSDRQPLHDSQQVIQRLQEELYSWVEEHRETVIINDAGDDRAASLARGVPYKILCTPVLDGSGHVAGVLVIVNEFSKPNFTNSDKNLLSVMARKAGKIIQANYDALTGLVNRGGFEYFLDAAIADVRGTSKQHCILHINIDQLRVVNDTAGHNAGDEVIRQMVATAAAHLRESDTLARIGGDQFGVLLQSCTLKHGHKIAEQMRKSVEEMSVSFDERVHKVTISMGLATLGAETQDLASALAGAELACGECSEQGGNRIETYHDENSELVQRRRQMQLVEKIQSAISEDQFVLYSQVIEPLQDADQQRHFEILLRMLDGDEIVSPGLFIPAAERYHLMPAIDRWVVRHTFEVLQQLPTEVLLDSLFAINLSGQSLGDNGFLKFLRNAVAESPIPKQSICFEITETAAIRNLAEAKHFITTLGALGCQFSLDDFGVGLSSFSYLKSLPVDHLKIDGEFVKDLLNDQVSAAMVAAINQIGHTMGLLTIAEFVESDEIRARLTAMGIDFAQGYGVGMPMPLRDQLAAIEQSPATAAM
jgi:diguanylate cyclase (GGDEF)-like protein